MLRQWRDRVVPGDVGLPQGAHRRATGLRREELARLAGISVDYLTRLEQGRASSPSTQVVEALARALRLSSTERERLFLGAGMPAPGPGIVPTHVAPSVQRLLDRLANTPVAVYDAAWNLIQANAPYDALMGDTSQLRGNDRNAVWRNLVGSGSRARQSAQEHDDQVARLVADLRLTAARYPNDRPLRALVAELREASAAFDELWAGALDAAAEQSRHKIIDHPLVGAIELDCDILAVAGDDLRVMVYTAEPGSEGADKLELAVVLGAQAVS
ncbi:XRE family transcriptional regulator [Microbacterium protaetiae]|uniref:XRE family transcriptional regulator n=2 Tax=Microbacterium protaetiae TaxID=2509458 RepID=A0A4P6EH07_9MICO|nr:XRE family transcriptional regulator [Microbacterium protaetiae]